MSVQQKNMIAKNTRSQSSGPRPLLSGPKLSSFRRTVLDFYKTRGRTCLPWRSTKNPYHVLVSEVMLQQTQVDRVIPYYKHFLKQFPTAKVLAEAPLRKVLRAWQGLGYNRRAKMLHGAAKTTMVHHSGLLPERYEDLLALPGVGEYTAKAVRTFAYGKPEVMIETNIRTVFLHHFFRYAKRKIPDQELLPYMVVSLDKKNPRDWYAALMDYGSHLKKTHPNPSRKSAHHTKQKAFKGSNREIRGALLRATLNGETISKLPFGKKRIDIQKAALKKEGLID